MKSLALLGLFVSIVTFSGCAGSYGSTSYNQGQVGSIQTIYRGTIVAIRNVEIGDGGLGTVGGAVGGGAVGSLFGGTTRDQQMATVAGAVLGGIAGNQLNRNSGQEITVKLDNGSEFTTVHKVSQSTPYSFRNGDRVKVYDKGGQISRIELE